MKRIPLCLFIEGILLCLFIERILLCLFIERILLCLFMKRIPLFVYWENSSLVCLWREFLSVCLFRSVVFVKMNASVERVSVSAVMRECAEHISTSHGEIQSRNLYLAEPLLVVIIVYNIHFRLVHRCSPVQILFLSFWFWIFFILQA